MVQKSLFDRQSHNSEKHPQEVDVQAPLALKARPKTLDLYRGQEHILKKYPFLQKGNFPSLIIWGPPGCGKTTLAKILVEHENKSLYQFNAVLGGVNDLRKIIDRALEMKKMTGDEPVIFIDEIHRFNKAQQDALLPFVEEKSFTLIGATTENPRRSINNALLSRVQIIELNPLDGIAIKQIIQDACAKFGLKISEDIIDFLANYSAGDARKALSNLEIVINRQGPNHDEIKLSEIKEQILENARAYDRNQDRHYDVISAFIKSIRGSDPNAAILWLATMLDGGEDPVFIARRLVILASEDVGNADPSALNLAVSGLQTVQQIGMPEARITLAQVTIYLASTVKSNASYLAIDQALEYVKNNINIEVPNHLKNYPPKEFVGKYLYPHDFPNHFVKQKYCPDGTPTFYHPTEMGVEKNIKNRLDGLKN